jgi:imidazolonepropionase-like amidohydrolase
VLTCARLFDGSSGELVTGHAVEVDRRGTIVMEFMVDAGMAPLEVMRSATSSAAELIGDESLGSIRLGARADFVAMTDDPTKDVSALRGIDWVMKDGRVYRDDRYRDNGETAR